MSRTVLVTDAGRTSAIACLRSLGQRGWRVIAADADARSAGFRSRFTSERFVYPAPHRSPRAFVESLLAFVAERRVDLVLPVTDECIHPLAHARARIEAVTRLAIAPSQALALATDKRATIALARELGLAVPQTRHVRAHGEARAAAADLRFPLVVKPTISRLYLPEEDRFESGKVSFARDLEGLERCLARMPPHQELLLQSYELGVGVGVECLAREGRVLRAFQHRRLAEIPVSGGASAWRESVPLDPLLFEQAARVAAALGWTGLLMVEFKLGTRPWFLEVNGRVWGSLPLACLAGVDFPAELAELYCPAPGAPTHAAEGAGGVTNGSHLPVVPAYRVGVRAYNFELMLSWITQVLLGRSRHPFLPRPGRERALAGLLGLLDPSQKSDLSGADYAPRLAEAGRIARKVAGMLTGGAAERSR